MSNIKVIKKLFGYFIISVTVMLFMFPFYWMVVTSTQEGTGLYRAENITCHSATGCEYPLSPAINTPLYFPNRRKSAPFEFRIVHYMMYVVQMW